jgi:hypothetical protein
MKMKKIYFFLIITLFCISCQGKTEFQELFNEGLYAESFFSSLDLKTVSSNSFENDELTRFTLVNHLPIDNEELTNIRMDNGMQIQRLVLSEKEVESMKGNFKAFVSSGKFECYYLMDNQYPEIDSSETHGMCDQMSSSLELFLGDNQMKLFGVHTIIDGEQFTNHKDKTKKYTKYFSVHMLDKKPDEDLVSNLTKTFFQEETLNDVRVVGNNILQCNLKVTSISEPDSSGCDEIENLLLEGIK